MTKVLPVIFTAVLSIAMLGCEQEGPAERAGAQIDEAVEEGKDNLEDAVETAGDKLEEVGDEIEKKAQ
jgi:hypothetical protein